jgi:hypothetical protein
MATNRDLLKEAIADAKAVKDMAIANAKAALEESFTPQLKSMLSAKLQEMEEEEEEESLKEFGKFSDDGENPDSSMFKKALDEEGELEEDLDLNELLNELNEEEEEEDMESEESEEEGEEKGEPLDLEDMTDEDLKKMIEDVIADMMSSGELDLEAGEAEEGEEMEPEMEMGEEEEEINLDELLAEIESLDKEEEELDEIFGLFGKKGGRNYKTVISQLLSDNDDLVKAIAAESDLAKRKQMAEPLLKKAFAEFGKLQNEEPSEKVIDNMSEFKREIFGDPRSLLQKLASGSSTQVAAREGIEEELAEAYSTIETLRKDLNEVNLLNAKLLYTNKIFKAKNLTESQKLNVLGMFDKATTVKETKLVFETLSEGLKTKSSPLKENLGSASKTMGTTNTKQPIVESDPMVARFQKLAGIK